ncbi:TauD/TfdA dioxygenase family protein [Maribacter sp. 2308TA10-17]|uniref:TauD/TfdA dioxygenase family protein n=1 Tax=Maribacter sp. 2308TA10-17 TaxID=3386276 RepID=UPI0039BC3CC3
MGIFSLFNSESEELSFKKVNDFFGVEVFGLPNVRKITDSQIEQLKKLILEYGVVVLRNKTAWTETEQITFTNMLGKLDSPVIYSTTTPSDPKVLKIWPNAQQSGLQWHSDRSYLERPSHLSIFQMVERPSIGNETAFLSLLEVYRNLPEDIKHKWANYHIVYATKKVMHPLFWVHPFNGKKTMYFDFRFAEEIVDICSAADEPMKIKDINKVVQVIDQMFTKEKAKYTHVWQQNDVLICDNYAISHKANLVSKTEEARVLIRSSTEGIYF